MLDGTQLPLKGAQQPPTFRSMSIVAKRSPISATAELLLYNLGKHRPSLKILLLSDFTDTCVHRLVLQKEFPHRLKRVSGL